MAKRKWENDADPADATDREARSWLAGLEG